MPDSHKPSSFSCSLILADEVNSHIYATCTARFCSPPYVASTPPRKRISSSACVANTRMSALSHGVFHVCTSAGACPCEYTCISQIASPDANVMVISDVPSGISIYSWRKPLVPKVSVFPLYVSVHSSGIKSHLMYREYIFSEEVT